MNGLVCCPIAAITATVPRTTAPTVPKSVTHLPTTSSASSVREVLGRAVVVEVTLAFAMIVFLCVVAAPVLACLSKL